jgi:hypothetical protein
MYVYLCVLVRDTGYLPITSYFLIPCILFFALQINVFCSVQCFGSSLVICGSGYGSGSSILDECGSGSSADPDLDSGKILSKFSERKQNKFCHLIFLTLNIFKLFA